MGDSALLYRKYFLVEFDIQKTKSHVKDKVKNSHGA